MSVRSGRAASGARCKAPDESLSAWRLLARWVSGTLNKGRAGSSRSRLYNTAVSPCTVRISAERIRRCRRRSIQPNKDPSRGNGLHTFRYTSHTSRCNSAGRLDPVLPRTPHRPAHHLFRQCSSAGSPFGATSPHRIPVIAFCSSPFHHPG